MLLPDQKLLCIITPGLPDNGVQGSLGKRGISEVESLSLALLQLLPQILPYKGLVFTSHEESAVETGQIIAKSLGINVRKNSFLGDADGIARNLNEHPPQELTTKQIRDRLSGFLNYPLLCLVIDPNLASVLVQEIHPKIRTVQPSMGPSEATVYDQSGSAYLVSPGEDIYTYQAN